MGVEYPVDPDRPVPTSIDKIVEAVLAELPEEDLKALASQEEFDPIVHHFGLGMWIRNRFIWPNTSLDNKYTGDHEDTLSTRIMVDVWQKARERFR